MTSEPLNQDTEIIKKSFYITFNYGSPDKPGGLGI